MKYTYATLAPQSRKFRTFFFTIVHHFYQYFQNPSTRNGKRILKMLVQIEYGKN